MAPVEALPKGLQPKWFEKSHLPRSLAPPVGFVPTNKAYVGRGTSKPDKAKVEVSSDVKKELHILTDGNMEDALILCETHRKLVKSKQYKDRLKANVLLNNAKVKEYNKVKNAKGGPNAARLEEIQDDLDELKAARSVYDHLWKIVSLKLLQKQELCKSTTHLL